MEPLGFSGQDGVQFIFAADQFREQLGQPFFVRREIQRPDQRGGRIVLMTDEQIGIEGE